MTLAASDLNIRRAEARKAFIASGVPNRRVEDWKYTDLHNSVSAQTVETTWGAAYQFSLPQGVEELSMVGAQLSDWAIQKLETIQTEGAMDAAALAFSRGDLVLRVPGSARVDEPLKLNFFAPGHAHIVLFVEGGASLDFIEEHQLLQGGFHNISLKIFMGPGAQLNHVRIAGRSSDLSTVETILVSQEINSSYRAHFANFGGKISRTELHVALNGEGAEAHLSGVSVLDDVHADVTVHMTHAVGKTQSTQLFKYVAGGHARGVYQGKVTVAHGANGSDSRQTAKGLLLEDRAEIDLKPELEILADDVKCAHGAAVGDLDAESLFYLRSRGIPEAEARALLMRAFLGDAIEQIENETIRATVWKSVDAALENMS